MRNLKTCIALAVATLHFISCSATRATENRVDAENMNLTQYQIDNNGSSTYIKLTSSTGIAKFNFTLPSGNYDIDVRYKSESIGQNTYIMYIANNQIVAWLIKHFFCQVYPLGSISLL